MEHTIKYVCETLNMTVHTVRHYCDMGLVPSLKYDANGNRMFDAEAVNWLKAAAFLRAAGLSIPQIRQYFDLCRQGASTVEERKDILCQLRQQAQADLQAAQERIECLSRKIDECEDFLTGRGEDCCNPLTW